jgi:hypothetical protein
VLFLPSFPTRNKAKLASCKNGRRCGIREERGEAGEGWREEEREKQTTTRIMRGEIYNRPALCGDLGRWESCRNGMYTQACFPPLVCRAWRFRNTPERCEWCGDLNDHDCIPSRKHVIISYLPPRVRPPSLRRQLPIHLPQPLVKNVKVRSLQSIKPRLCTYSWHEDAKRLFNLC